tara:strand:- start:622 stop:1509 length:888 start_codon:yes stop_codon:yes gene_type:complete
MITVNSISGGKTSSYIAANYPADYNVFALVRTNDKGCLFPDKKTRQIVSDRIGTEFIGTLEMDNIIYTMLDLEQYIGTKIDWVSGKTFEEVIEKPGILPNIKARYCTTEMKLFPIAKWWMEKFNLEPIEMRIGFRANEMRRAKKMNEKLENGLSQIKIIVGKHKNGNNKWKTFGWQMPTFPLISKENPIYKDDVVEYWKNKPVRFAEINNCVGCFHRNAALLKKMSVDHPNKFDWFIKQERIKQERIKQKDPTIKKYVYAQFKKDMSYQKIKDWNIQTEFKWDDFNECDSGYCGL